MPALGSGSGKDPEHQDPPPDGGSKNEHDQTPTQSRSSEEANGAEVTETLSTPSAAGAAESTGTVANATNASGPTQHDGNNLEPHDNPIRNDGYLPCDNEAEPVSPAPPGQVSSPLSPVQSPQGEDCASPQSPPSSDNQDEQEQAEEAPWFYGYTVASRTLGDENVITYRCINANMHCLTAYYVEAYDGNGPYPYDYGELFRFKLVPNQNSDAKYGAIGAYIDTDIDVASLSLAELDDLQLPVPSLTGTFTTWWQGGEKRHGFKLPDGKLLPVATASLYRTGAIHPVLQHHYSFRITVSGNPTGLSEVGGVQPVEYLGEHDVLSAELRSTWARRSKQPRTIWVGELGIGDVPINSLISVHRNAHKDYTLNQVVDTAAKHAAFLVAREQGYLQAAQKRNATLVEGVIAHAENKIARAKQVLAWIQEAKDGGEKVKLLINPKGLGIEVWTQVINNSFALPSPLSFFDEVNVVLRIDSASTEHNVHYINPIEERLVSRQMQDMTASRVILEGIVGFETHAKQRDPLSIPTITKTSNTTKCMVTTYKRQIGVQEHPTTTTITSASSIRDATLAKAFAEDATAVRIAYQNVDHLKAQAALKALVNTEGGRQRLALRPVHAQHRALQGFKEWQVNITSLPGDNMCDDDDSAQLAEGLAKRLMSPEYGGMFFAISNTDYNSTNDDMVNILLGNATKLDPGIIAQITSNSCAYPVGYQTVRVRLRDDMKVAGRLTRKLERVCTSYNKKASAAAKKQKQRNPGLIMALYPIVEANNQVLWLEKQPSRRGWGDASGAPAGQVNNEQPHGAALVGLHMQVSENALHAVLNALGVDVITRSTATWAHFPNHATGKGEWGITLAFRDDLSKAAFLGKDPLVTNGIIAAPRALNGGECRLHGPALPAIGMLANGVSDDAKCDKVLATVLPPFDTKRRLERLTAVKAQLKIATAAKMEIAAADATPDSSPPSASSTRPTAKKNSTKKKASHKKTSPAAVDPSQPRITSRLSRSTDHKEATEEPAMEQQVEESDGKHDDDTVTATAHDDDGSTPERPANANVDSSSSSSGSSSSSTTTTTPPNPTAAAGAVQNQARATRAQRRAADATTSTSVGGKKDQDVLKKGTTRKGAPNVTAAAKKKPGGKNKEPRLQTAAAKSKSTATSAQEAAQNMWQLVTKAMPPPPSRRPAPTLPSANPFEALATSVQQDPSPSVINEQTPGTSSATPAMSIPLHSLQEAASAQKRARTSPAKTVTKTAKRLFSSFNRALNFASVEDSSPDPDDTIMAQAPAAIATPSPSS